MEAKDWQELATHLAPAVAQEGTEMPSLPRSRAELEAQLGRAMLHMLQHHFGSVPQLMYRLDIPEHRFNEALSAPSLPEAAARLATLMVDRELIRMETRRRFGSNPRA